MESIGLICRVTVLTLLIGASFVEYLSTKNRQRMIANLEKIVKNQEGTIENLEKIIKNHEKNIELRKQKMGY